MGSFTRAERKKTPIKLAITGTSGSGKTFSALRLARGLGATKGASTSANRFVTVLPETIAPLFR